MPSPQVIIVDDTDGAISYSGPWSPVSNPGAHDGTLHQTSTSGSSNTLTYVGSPSVTIFGSSQPCDGHRSNAIYQITMDGVTTPIMSVVCDKEFQNGLSVNAQGQGTSGVNARHVVTLTNLGGSQNLPLMLDYIQYISYVDDSPTSVAQPPPPSTTPAGSPANQGSTPTTTPTAGPAVHSSSSSASPAVGQSSGVATSSGLPQTTSTTSSPLNSGSKSLSPSTTVELTTISGVATSITVVTTPTPTTGSNDSNVSSTSAESRSSSRAMTGAIVGGIIAAIIFTLLLVLLYSRRRRILRYIVPSEESGENVSPFHLAPNSSSEEDGVLAHGPSHPTFPVDEKRAMASAPVSRPHTADSTQAPEAVTRAETEYSSSSSPSVVPLIPMRQRSPSPSSTAVLPYLRESNVPRGQYTSGISGFSDVPPAYDSVRNTGMAAPAVPIPAPPSPTSELEYH